MQKKMADMTTEVSFMVGAFSNLSLFKELNHIYISNTLFLRLVLGFKAAFMLDDSKIKERK